MSPSMRFFLQHAQVIALLDGIVVRIAEKHAITARRALILDTARELGEIRVRAVRHHEPDRRRRARLQRARDRGRHVVEFDDRPLHLRPDIGRELFTTWDTVVNDTPAMAATSLIVAIY